MTFHLSPFAAVAAIFFTGVAPARPASLSAQTWPMYQYAGDHNAVFDEPDWDSTWTAKLGDRINGGLSIVGDTLYVESLDRRLYALDARTGTQHWNVGLPNVAMNAPLVADGLVFAGTGSSHVLYDYGTSALIGIDGGDYIYAVNATTGSVVWRYRTPGEAMPTGMITLLGNRPAFLFSTGDGYLRALNAADGRLLWQSRFPGYASMSSLAAFNGLAIGGSSVAPKFSLQAYASGRHALIANQGWTWAARINDGQFAWISPFGWGDCSPVVEGGLVFVEGIVAQPTPSQTGSISVTASTPLQARVYALDASNGAKRWEYDDPELGPATGGGSLELAIAGMYSAGVFYDSLIFSNTFAAFDAKTGKVRWSIHTGRPVKMSAVEYRGDIYVGDIAGYLYVIRAADGKVEAKVKFPDIFATSPPVIVGETLFVANGDTVYALRLKDLKQGIAPRF